jgi:hypothetical protein
MGDESLKISLQDLNLYFKPGLGSRDSKTIIRKICQENLVVQCEVVCQK